MVLFSVCASCSRCAFRNFGEAYCHHLQGEWFWFPWMLKRLGKKILLFVRKTCRKSGEWEQWKGRWMGLFMYTNVLLTLTSALFHSHRCWPCICWITSSSYFIDWPAFFQISHINFTFLYPQRLQNERETQSVFLKMGEIHRSEKS